MRCLPSPIVLRNKEQVAQWTAGKNRIKIGILLLLSLTHSLTHSFWRYMWPRLLYGTVTTKTSENLFLPTLQHPLFPEDDEELCKESFKFSLSLLFHACARQRISQNNCKNSNKRENSKLLVIICYYYKYTRMVIKRWFFIHYIFPYQVITCSRHSFLSLLSLWSFLALDEKASL